MHIGNMGGTQTGGDGIGQQTGTGADGEGHVPGQHTGDGQGGMQDPQGGGQGPQAGGQGPQGMHGLQMGKQGFGKGSYISITGPMQLFTHG